MDKLNSNWKPSDRQKDAVVSDSSIRPNMEKSDIDFYGGHVVAESIVPEYVNLVAAAPDLYNALIDILPHAEVIINKNHPALRNAYEALAKATKK